MPELEVVDIMVEVDKNGKRGKWKMSQVHRILKSTDTLVRKSGLLSPEEKIYLRPISFASQSAKDRAKFCTNV